MVIAPFCKIYEINGKTKSKNISMCSTTTDNLLLLPLGRRNKKRNIHTNLANMIE